LPFGELVEKREYKLRQTKPPSLFYGYVVVLVAALIMVVTWGTIYSFGVFFKPMLTDLGWTRATISGAYSLTFVVNGLLGIFAGRLCDRFGPRVVVSVCGLLIVLGYLLMSQVHAIWHMRLFYVLIIGTGLSGIYVPAITTVARWFIKRRGLMTGIVIAGISVGTLVTSLVANWLISSYGWRTSYIVMGIAVLVLVTLAAQFLKRDPAQLGLVPYGESEAGENNSDFSIRGLSLSQAVRTRQFWMLCLMLPFFEFGADTIMVHIVPRVTDEGFSAASAAGVLATIGGLSLVGRVSMGGIGDRIGNRRVFTLGMGIAVLTLVWLLFAGELWMFYLFAVVYSLGYGGLVALQTLLIADLFGVISLGVILGMIIFIGALGEAVGPAVGGWIFDITGSYRWAFLTSALLCILAIFLTALLKPVTRKNRD
jgi:MFS family permease